MGKERVTEREGEKEHRGGGGERAEERAREYLAMTLNTAVFPALLSCQTPLEPWV